MSDLRNKKRVTQTDNIIFHMNRVRKKINFPFYHINPIYANLNIHFMTIIYPTDEFFFFFFLTVKYYYSCKKVSVLYYNTM